MTFPVQLEASRLKIEETLRRGDGSAAERPFQREELTCALPCHVGALCNLCTPALWHAIDAAISWSVPHSPAERSAPRVKSDPHETLSQQAGAHFCTC